MGKKNKDLIAFIISVTISFLFLFLLILITRNSILKFSYNSELEIFVNVIVGFIGFVGTIFAVIVSNNANYKNLLKEIESNNKPIFNVYQYDLNENVDGYKIEIGFHYPNECIQKNKIDQKYYFNRNNFKSKLNERKEDEGKLYYDFNFSLKNIGNGLATEVLFELEEISNFRQIKNNFITKELNDIYSNIKTSLPSVIYNDNCYKEKILLIPPLVIGQGEEETFAFMCGKAKDNDCLEFGFLINVTYKSISKKKYYQKFALVKLGQNLTLYPITTINEIKNDTIS